MGEDFSAKDFRTWGGTKLTVELYDQAISEVKKNSRLQFEPTLVKLVAKKLGNTKSTCREYYIHPKVLEAAQEHSLPQAETAEKFTNLSEEENRVMQILNDQ